MIYQLVVFGAIGEKRRIGIGTDCSPGALYCELGTVRTRDRPTTESELPEPLPGRWSIARRRPEDRSVQSSVRSEVRYTHRAHRFEPQFD